MNLTEEQILNLAPDESSRKAGKALAGTANWVSVGANERALWGECKGSGSKPYQTQVDLSTVSFKCSCPSRKFPCKHGLGLMLLYVKEPSFFTENAMPDWVAEWIDKRTERLEKQAEKKEKVVDEAAQAKRQSAREQKISDGIEELLLWMKDIIRHGMLTVPEKGHLLFANMSRRMIDAQAPGLARMVAMAGNINFFEDGWQQQLLDQLARIYLVASGFKNQDKIESPLKQDIRTFIGFPQSQDSLAEEPVVKDHWLVLAKEVIEEDTVTTERFWLYGMQTGKYALVLQFLIRGQGGQLTLMPGTYIDGELIFYPSILPQRATVKNYSVAGNAAMSKFFTNWSDVLTAQAKAYSLLPFKNPAAYVVENIRPVLLNETWHLQDEEQRVMPIKKGFDKLWSLLALSGGNAVAMSVVGLEKEFEPMGVWIDGIYKVLS
ncbi:SWIM zinc finger family protein [Taibaiella soli]|uniref:SWIM zinc finger family protein n=1 Tax=Taibaiella soli TaxID=1649169 RepID=A0A2W2B1I0_9BACT|nr:SWIM zinc finger family protein [Taibaiella soli]PZF74104.1 SWIM zinc finger family protein [Taibaiella soli]